MMQGPVSSLLTTSGLRMTVAGEKFGRWAIPAPLSSHYLEQATFVVLLLGIFSHNHSP